MDLELLQFGTEEMRWGQCSPEDLLAAGGKLWGKVLACCKLVFLFFEQKLPCSVAAVGLCPAGKLAGKGKATAELTQLLTFPQVLRESRCLWRRAVETAHNKGWMSAAQRARSLHLICLGAQGTV